MLQGFARTGKGRLFHVVAVDSWNTARPGVMWAFCGYQPRRWYPPYRDLMVDDPRVCAPCKKVQAAQFPD